MTLTNDATLTWQWATNYRFTADGGANGSVSGSTNGWYALGGSVTVTATPDAHYHFCGWTGDVAGPTRTPRRMTLTMDQARSMTAQLRAGHRTR